METATRSLGGLVITTTSGASEKGIAKPVSQQPKNTELNLLGKEHKTALPGVHYGQIPFAGMYYKAVGQRVS
jgi:hypothetical protein